MSNKWIEKKNQTFNSIIKLVSYKFCCDELCFVKYKALIRKVFEKNKKIKLSQQPVIFLLSKYKYLDDFTVIVVIVTKTFYTSKL